MLVEIYIEAILIDERLADRVWNDSVLTDGAARIAWLMIAGLFWPDD
jgi:hypothetical protein